MLVIVGPLATNLGFSRHGSVDVRFLSACQCDLLYLNGRFTESSFGRLGFGRVEPLRVVDSDCTIRSI